MVSLLVGISLAEGVLDSLDERYLDALPLYRSDKLDVRVNDLSIRHLLTMRAGFDYIDGGTNSDVLAGSADWIAAFLRIPSLSAPGEAIAHRSATSTAAFAAEHLLEPLQVTARAWDIDPKGVSNGGTGLCMTPRDMARLGQVVLRRCHVGGRRG